MSTEIEVVNQVVATAADLVGKYLTFALGEEEYGVPVLKVREIIKMMDITLVPQVPHHVKGVINLRGIIVPLVDLRVKFGFPDAAAAPVVIILSIARRVIGEFIRGIAPRDDRMLIVFDIARLMMSDDFALVSPEAEAA